MIGRIAGTLVEKNPPQVVVVAHGVGYEIDVPMSTFYNLPRTGEAVELLTHLVVREDAYLLAHVQRSKTTDGTGDMDRHSADIANPQGIPASTGGTASPRAPRRSFASRLLGYDIFPSFALGPPPRGTHSYASDLARRLRERDFNVFFSEDEAPPGEQLDSTLRAALLRSKTLVVIANRGMLQEPRWVRKEVEEFR